MHTVNQNSFIATGRFSFAVRLRARARLILSARLRVERSSSEHSHLCSRPLLHRAPSSSVRTSVVCERPAARPRAQARSRAVERRRWAPRAMPSLDFDEKPKHLSRFDLSGEPASSSPSKPKAKIVEIG